MIFEEFQSRLNKLNEGTNLLDNYVSPDFQCDATGGYPTSLCVNWDKGKAWLQLNESINLDADDLSRYEQLCADYGIRDCNDIEQYNQILSSLGEDAYSSASLSDEDEDFIINM